MTKVLDTKPENTTIEVRTCYDRGGHMYKHAFIGEYAISSRLANILKSEFGFWCGNGRSIPDKFFSKYELIAVEPDYSDPKRERFVTSDYWYTCNPDLQTVIVL